MIFQKDQVEQLLRIIDFHHSFVMTTNLGVSVLSDYDKFILKLFGVDWEDYMDNLSYFDKMFMFGKLSAVLGDTNAGMVTFEDFLKYTITGRYIPLTKGEQIQLELSKRKSYTHLKGLKERVRSDFENSLISQEQYLETVSEGMTKGVEERKSVTAIISDMGHKLEQWKHDWGRIVETESQNLHNLGRAQEYAEKYGEDVLVFKTVYPQACRHCIHLYLTKGLGSKPIVMKLSDVVKNGDNIGKKVQDWKFIVGATHPYCRCELRRVPEGYKWNEEVGKFTIPKDWVRKVERKSKVKITVGSKQFEV